jgi:hypothetical protein
VGHTIAATTDATIFGAPAGALIHVATLAAGAVELLGGAIISFIPAITESITAVDEAYTSGAYAQLTEKQKTELDNVAKKNAASSWTLAAGDDKEKLLAGQKVIANTENAYEAYYSDEAVSKSFNGKYEVNSAGNPELQFTKGGKDIKKSDLSNVIRDLGYKDWSEAAAALGMEWDESVGGVEGLYATDSEGNKQYFDVSNHG